MEVIAYFPPSTIQHNIFGEINIFTYMDLKRREHNVYISLFMKSCFDETVDHIYRERDGGSI
jgi:hypothetical protein